MPLTTQPPLPVIIITPVLQEQYASQTARIACYFPNQDLLWNGPALNSSTANERVTIMNGVGESVLNINNLVEEDEGQYYCSYGVVESEQSTLLIHRKELILPHVMSSNDRRVQYS